MCNYSREIQTNGSLISKEYNADKSLAKLESMALKDEYPVAEKRYNGHW